MRALGMAVFAAVGIAAAGTAGAADLTLSAPPGPVAVSAPSMDRGFDWSRFYGGVQGGLWYRFDPPALDSVRGVGVVGRNVSIGARVVVGAELIGGAYYSTALGIAYDTMAVARAGVLLGDRVLAYAALGIGYDFGVADDAFMVAGGGLERAVGSSRSVRGEVLAFRYLGAPFSYVAGSVGLSWHFGR